jgi:acetyl esterase/lipase
MEVIMSLENIRNESHPDSGSQKFLKALNSSGGTPMEKMQPNDAREVLVGAQKGANVKLPACDVSQKEINVSGEKIQLYIVRPQGVKEKLPVFMFFHGGGWVIGDFPTHERFVRDMVVESGMACVFVEYTRSPEAPYPKAINQAYAATKWVAENGNEINVDGSRLAVAGNSAGGNIAAAVAIMAKEKKTPEIRFQLLMWPVTNANFETDSYNQFSEGHFLTKNMMKWFWDSYTKDEKQRKEIYASPLQASSDQLKGLPPTLFQIAECDVLRDEGEAYARKLDEAGVDVTTTRYVGMIHDFGLLNALANLPEVRSAFRQSGQELKKHLQLH